MVCTCNKLPEYETEEGIVKDKTDATEIVAILLIAAFAVCAIWFVYGLVR